MTKQEIIYAIKDGCEGKNLTSSIITDELVSWHIDNTRAQLIKQDLIKGHTIDSYLIQSLGCLDLVLVDKSECCNVPIGCKILRTSVPIPSPLELHNKQLITRVGPIDLTELAFSKIE